jgi:hypothetical protein
MDDNLINRNLGSLSLGERMVFLARLAAIRHIEIAQAQQEVRPPAESPDVSLVDDIQADLAMRSTLRSLSDSAGERRVA